MGTCKPTFNARKLGNTNGNNIDGFFLLVNYGEIYRQNIFSQCPSVYTDEIFVYTSRVTMRKEGMKKKKKTMYQAYKIKY
jgi:hypothetical protein